MSSQTDVGIFIIRLWSKRPPCLTLLFSAPSVLLFASHFSKDRESGKKTEIAPKYAAPQAQSSTSKMRSLSILLTGLLAGSSAYSSLLSENYVNVGDVLKDTDWEDALVSNDPFPELIINDLDHCIDACKSRPECSAVSFNPLMSQAVCQLKCTSRASRRVHRINFTAAVVRPNATSCPEAAFVPQKWRDAAAKGFMLISGPNQPGGWVANGYVGAWITSLPGSGGPTQKGVEHVAGVYAGSSRRKPVYPKWPNKACASWCDRAHRVDLPSFTSTAILKDIPATATAMDFQNGAFLRFYKSGDLTCTQRIFAHRKHFHVLVSEFWCENLGKTNVNVTITEPGPSNITGHDGESFVSAPLEEVNATRIDSGDKSLICDRYVVEISETKAQALTVVGACRTNCEDTKMTIMAGESASLSCISTRHASIDLDATGQDPAQLAMKSWKVANAAANKLFASHQNAMSILLSSRIELEGNLPLAQVVNSSFNALLGAYRDDAIPGAGSAAIMSDGYAGNILWDVDTWASNVYLFFQRNVLF